MIFYRFTIWFRFTKVLFAFTCSSFLPSGSADVESLSQGSSDEESEKKEGRGKLVTVTSMDEALRTVNDAGDHSQKDFLKQNFEMLADSCGTGKTKQALRFSEICFFLMSQTIMECCF